MGKLLIIKGADFHANKVTHIDQGYDNLIPADDTELEYIGAGGSNCVEVPEVEVDDTCKIAFKLTSSTTASRVLTSNDDTYDSILFDTGQKKLNIGIKNDITAIQLTNMVNVYCEVVCDKTKYTINEQEYNISRTYQNSGYTDYLFSRPGKTSAVSYIYYYEIVDVLKLLPVLHSGVPCFYDTLSGTYYNITGSGSIVYREKNGSSEVTYQ